MSFALDENLITEMDQKRGALSRSAWIRVAIVRMLGLNDDAARPPAREGLSRGGKPTHKKLPQTVGISASSAQRAAEHLPQTAEGRSPQISKPQTAELKNKTKTKLKSVPGTGKPDEKANAG